MTIKRGQPWGIDAPIPSSAPRVTSDAALVTALATDPAAVPYVTGGDLHRSLGSPVERSHGVLIPIDLLDVVVDGRRHRAAAHVVVRRPGRRGWWRGPIVAAMNVEHLGRFDVAPRAHPNDGRVDVVTVSAAMTVRQRLEARRRLATGTHLPHPAITVQRVTATTIPIAAGAHVWVDGVDVGGGAEVHLTVLADAATVCL